MAQPTSCQLPYLSKGQFERVQHARAADARAFPDARRSIALGADVLRIEERNSGPAGFPTSPPDTVGGRRLARSIIDTQAVTGPTSCSGPDVPRDCKKKRRPS